MRTGRPVFCVLAAAYSGAAVYYMTSTGASIAMSFYFYLGVMMVMQKKKYLAAVCAVLVPVVAFVLFWLTLGHHVWGRVFWGNMIEYLVFFAHGHGGGALPIHESLKYRHYWAAFMAFSLPLFYTATLLSIGCLVYLRKIKGEHVLAAVIAVYGLANYEYFVVRSAVTNYYINALPFVLLCCFWLNLGLQRLEARTRGRVVLGVVLLGFYALFTNQNYISYPNLFNFSKNPMVDVTVAQLHPDRQGYFSHLVKAVKEEDKLPVNSLGETVEDIRTERDFKSDEELKGYFRQASDFSEDARLIQSLTKQGERIALVSSFETKLLIQAQRRPFFYHIPLLTSQPMRLRMYPPDAAHSPRFLADTLRQLDVEKPAYVFVENVFLQERIPASTFQNNANMTAIAAHIREHYRPHTKGKYLTAMRRKDL